MSECFFGQLACTGLAELLRQIGDRSHDPGGIGKLNDTIIAGIKAIPEN